MRFPWQHGDDPEPVARPVPRLQLESGVNDNGDRVRSGAGGIPYVEAEPSKGMMPSGIYLIVQFGKYVKEGEYEQTPREAQIIKADSAMAAMQKVYMDEIDSAKRKGDTDNLYSADARFVVFDFYTGERLEALIEGEWRANIIPAKENMEAPVG